MPSPRGGLEEASPRGGREEAWQTMDSMALAELDGSLADEYPREKLAWQTTDSVAFAELDASLADECPLEKLVPRPRETRLCSAGRPAGLETVAELVGTPRGGARGWRRPDEDGASPGGEGLSTLSPVAVVDSPPLARVLDRVDFEEKPEAPRVSRGCSTAELAAELVEKLTARDPKESPLLGPRGESAGGGSPMPPARPEAPLPDAADQSLSVMEQSSVLAEQTARGGAPACGLLCAEARGCLSAGPQSISQALCRALGGTQAAAALAPRRMAAPAGVPPGEPPPGVEASPAAARRGGAGARDGPGQRLFSSPSPRRRPPLTPGSASAQKERARSVERYYAGLVTADQYEGTLFELCTAAATDDNQVHRAAVQLAVPSLVELLRQGPPETREQAALGLGRLAKCDADFKSLIVRAEAVPPLVAMLGEEATVGEREQAAATLTCLATHSRENRAVIAAAGAIPPLVACLHGAGGSKGSSHPLCLSPGEPPADTAREAPERDQADIVSAAGLAPPASTPRLQAMVARALARLSRSNGNNKAQMVLSGAIPRLVALLKSGDPVVRTEAAAALGSLAANNEGYAAEIRLAASAAACGLEAVDLAQAEAPVLLHIYDVSGDARVHFVNELFRPIGTGAFHAGVEVYGSEWSFGCREERGTGVFSCGPRRNPAHSYRETVHMDVTTLSRQEVTELLSRLEREWHGRDYDLLSRNCCHFSDALCRGLGVGPIPSWIMKLAVTGEMVLNGVQTAVTGAQVAAVAAAETAQAAAQAVRQMDERYQLWDTAEAAARSMLSRISGSPAVPAASPGSKLGGSPASPSPARTLLAERKETGAVEQRRPPPQKQPPPVAPASKGFEEMASGFFGLAAQLWHAAVPSRGPAAPASTMRVTLECVLSASVDLRTVPPGHRRLRAELVEGRPWRVGRRDEPEAMARLLRPAAAPQDCLFEIAWEPPCLVLIKPSRDSLLRVNGSLVKQTTFVLLQNSEIGVGDARDGSKPILAFRVQRESNPAPRGGSEGEGALESSTPRCRPAAHCARGQVGDAMAKGGLVDPAGAGTRVRMNL